MNHVFVLLTMMGGVTHVTGNQCEKTNNILECSLPAGETLFMQVISNASGHQVFCRKQLDDGQMTNVFTLKKEKFTVQHEGFRNRTEFFIYNGTFKISNLQHSDSGHYTTQVFDQNGVLVSTTSIQMDVQEKRLILMIAVAIAGGAVFVLMILLCVCCCVRRRKKKSGSTV